MTWSQLSNARIRVKHLQTALKILFGRDNPKGTAPDLCNEIINFDLTDRGIADAVLHRLEENEGRLSIPALRAVLGLKFPSLFPGAMTGSKADIVATLRNALQPSSSGRWCTIQ